MTHVRRHIRITASGKRATVRAHERDVDDGIREVPGWVQSSYVGDLTPAPIRARCSYPGCDDGRLSDGRDCPHCYGDGEVLMPVTETLVTEEFWDDDDQDARDSVTYGEPVDKSDIGAWADEMAARDRAAAADPEWTIAPSDMGSPWIADA